MKIATNQQRLNELFDADPRNDTAIAEELGVSKQTISAWRKGIRSPKKHMLVRISIQYNVSLEWLMGFDVERTPSAFTEVLDPSPKTLEARILAKGVDKMPPAQREAIMNMMMGLYPGLFNEEDDAK